MAQVIGQFQGRMSTLTTQIVYKDRRDYWINGLVCALVARTISEGKSVEPGLHCLTDAVDPITFMAELKKEGVEQTENFAPCDLPT